MNNPCCDFILAIDPGNEESAFCFINKWSYEPIYFAKMKNKEAVEAIKKFIADHRMYCTYEAAIERVASYGMAVGASVFQTCEWIGRFSQILEDTCFNVTYIYRKDEKMNICGQMKAKDSNIRVALIDRFAKHDLKTGKGTKNNPDWFYGFAKDVWASYAVGVTYLDTYVHMKGVL